MSIRTPAAITVTTTATRLDGADTDHDDKSSIIIKPAAAIFVGGPDVTASAGFPVAAGETFSGELGYGEKLYGITASGTSAVSVFEAGV